MLRLLPRAKEVSPTPTHGHAYYGIHAALLLRWAGEADMHRWSHGSEAKRLTLMRIIIKWRQVVVEAVQLTPERHEQIWRHEVIRSYQGTLF
ncbi:hypothetical protein N0V93_007283 [Gnomoniopsis smithogilvyi]|uniref:Uncharacterized protein n=1 Tax=Gnomoniopsis smithogilvyi TaxID=1191159 RepID=A0A9W9CWE7_9PEZI|nr:hypothetical protein N0V93_007283 [Gnomoniopsis smithogilvyi]